MMGSLNSELNSHPVIIIIIIIIIRIIRIIIIRIIIIRIIIIIIAIIIIIIIMAGMAVVNVAGYLIEQRRRWPIITASPRGQCSK